VLVAMDAGMKTIDAQSVGHALIDMDLIAFDGTRFQVLSLPDALPSSRRAPLTTSEDLENHDPATISATILSSLDPSSR
jgi:hypothetical protein